MEDKRKQKAVPALPKRNTKLYDAFFNLPRVDLHDPQAVQERTDAYREYVNQSGIAPLWTDFAFCLGYSRRYLYDVREGRTGERYPQETRLILERVHLWLEASLAQVGMENPQKSIMTIWLQKNCFAYSDRLEISPPAQHTLLEEQTSEDVIKRLALASVPELADGTIEEVESFLKASESTETGL